MPRIISSPSASDTGYDASVLQAANLPAPGDHWPLSLPLVQRTRRVQFADGITVLAGENGSGKSTLLEALAIAADLPAAGSRDRPADDASLAALRPLADGLRLEWTVRSRRGMFLRAEDFLGYVREQNARDAALQLEAARLRRDNPGMPELELRRIQGPYLGPVAARAARYEGDLDARSHGEAFLSFFQSRLRGKGLYLLDEPEAALSPVRQLAFLSVLKAAVAAGAQFVIATHAPIVMAAPGALVLELRDGELLPTGFDELEHVRTLRAFLDGPEAFLRHL